MARPSRKLWIERLVPPINLQNESPTVEPRPRDENGENPVAPQIRGLGYEFARMNARQFLLLASLSLCPTNASAQSVDKEHEPAATVELGGAAGWDVKGEGLW